MSVHIERFGNHWTDFHEIWYLSIFRKCAQKIQVSLNPDKNNGYHQCTFIVMSCSFRLGMKSVADTLCRENQNTNFKFSRVVKCCRFEQATYDNVTQRMRFACWMTKGYKYTLRICNNHCFSSAKMVTSVCFNLTFYLQWLYCKCYLYKIYIWKV